MKSWEEARADFAKNNPTDNVFLDKVEKAVKDQGLAAILEIGKAVKAQTDDPVKANRQSTLLGKAEAPIWLSGESDLTKMIAPIIDMTDATWLARHVLYLEREIARVELARIRQPVLTNTIEQKIATVWHCLSMQRSWVQSVLLEG